MAQTFAQLKTYCRDHAYSDDTARGDRNLEHLINNAIREVVTSFDWPHLTKRLSFRTRGPFSLNTASVTHGTTTVTGAGTNWLSDNLVGGLLWFTGEETFYEIASVETNTSLTIETAYTNPDGSNLSLVEYEVLFPRYAWPSDFMSMKRPEEGSFFQGLDRIFVDRWLSLTLNNKSASTPSQYAVDGDYFYLYPAPVDQRVVYAMYYYMPTALSADTDTIDWPDNLLNVIHRALDKHMAIDRGQGEAYQLAVAEFEREMDRCRSAFAPSREAFEKMPESMHEASRGYWGSWVARIVNS